MSYTMRRSGHPVIRVRTHGDTSRAHVYKSLHISLFTRPPTMYISHQYSNQDVTRPRQHYYGIQTIRNCKGLEMSWLPIGMNMPSLKHIAKASLKATECRCYRPQSSTTCVCRRSNSDFFINSDHEGTRVLWRSQDVPSIIWAT